MIAPKPPINTIILCETVTVNVYRALASLDRFCIDFNGGMVWFKRKKMYRSKLVMGKSKIALM
jgi:hypothetical protein